MMADLGGYVDPDTLEEIQRCEEQIRQRIPRGDGLAVRAQPLREREYQVRVGAQVDREAQRCELGTHGAA